MARDINQSEASENMRYVVGVADSVNWPGLFLLADEGALRIMSGATDSRGYPAKPPVYELWDEDDVIGVGIERSNVELRGGPAVSSPERPR